MLVAPVGPTAVRLVTHLDVSRREDAGRRAAPSAECCVVARRSAAASVAQRSSCRRPALQEHLADRGLVAGGPALAGRGDGGDAEPDDAGGDRPDGSLLQRAVLAELLGDRRAVVEDPLDREDAAVAEVPVERSAVGVGDLRVAVDQPDPAEPWSVGRAGRSAPCRSRRPTSASRCRCGRRPCWARRRSPDARRSRRRPVHAEGRWPARSPRRWSVVPCTAGAEELGEDDGDAVSGGAPARRGGVRRLRHDRLGGRRLVVPPPAPRSSRKPPSTHHQRQRHDDADPQPGTGGRPRPTAIGREVRRSRGSRRTPTRRAAPSSRRTPARATRGPARRRRSGPGQIRGLVGSVPSWAPQLVQKRPTVTVAPQCRHRSVWPSMEVNLGREARFDPPRPRP